MFFFFYSPFWSCFCAGSIILFSFSLSFFVLSVGVDVVYVSCAKASADCVISLHSPYPSAPLFFRPHFPFLFSHSQTSFFFLDCLVSPCEKAPESRYTLFSPFFFLDLFMYISTSPFFSVLVHPARGGSFHSRRLYRERPSSVRPESNGKMWHARTNWKRRPIPNGPLRKKKKKDIEKGPRFLLFFTLFAHSMSACRWTNIHCLGYENKNHQSIWCFPLFRPVPGCVEIQISLFLSRFAAGGFNTAEFDGAIFLI